MRWLGGAALLCTLFYLCTAIVWSEGEPSYALVLKPRPDIAVELGGGEDGTWARHHPNAPPPWWQSKNLNVIAFGSYEIAGTRWWLDLYELGLLLVPLLWIGFVAALLARLVQLMTARPGHSRSQ
jgi:hypothetical protein